MLAPTSTAQSWSGWLASSVGRATNKAGRLFNRLALIAAPTTARAGAAGPCPPTTSSMGRNGRRPRPGRRARPRE